MTQISHVAKMRPTLIPLSYSLLLLALLLYSGRAAPTARHNHPKLRGVSGERGAVRGLADKLTASNKSRMFKSSSMKSSRDDSSTYVPTLNGDDETMEPSDFQTFVPSNHGSSHSGSTKSPSSNSKSMKSSSSKKSSGKSKSRKSATFAPTMDESITETIANEDFDDVETSDPTLSPTVSNSEERDDNSENNAEKPQDPEVPTGECQDNPEYHDVVVDVQITYPDQEFAACDSADQDNNINAVIRDTLNEFFPYTVSDWEGDAIFGDFIFDYDQEVNNVDPFGGFRRERRRGLRRSVSVPQERRFLQEGTCPGRDHVECDADYCRWGCLRAATTDCGTSALTNWVLLADDIQSALAELGYDCLGVPEELKIVIMVDPAEGGIQEEQEGDGTRSFPASEAPAAVVTLPKDVLADPNSILTDMKDAKEEAVNDAVTAIISINSKLQVFFFKDKARELPPEEETVLFNKFRSFFTDLLQEADFGNEFIGFDMTNIQAAFEEENDKLVFTFTSIVDMVPDTAETARTIAAVLSEGDFKHYIPTLRESIDHINAVIFTATGHGERM